MSHEQLVTIPASPLLFPFSGSSTHSMGVYHRGFGAAFTTQMELLHLGRDEWCPGQAGLARCHIGDLTFHVFISVDYR